MARRGRTFYSKKHRSWGFYRYWSTGTGRRRKQSKRFVKQFRRPTGKFLRTTTRINWRRRKK